MFNDWFFDNIDHDKSIHSRLIVMILKPILDFILDLFSSLFSVLTIFNWV